MITINKILISSSIAVVAALQGCASMDIPAIGEVRTEAAGVSIGYVQRDTGLDAWANTKAVDLSVYESETDAALAVFGLPKLSWVPEGAITYTSSVNASATNPPLWLQPEYKGPSSYAERVSAPNLTDATITVGLGSSNGGLAAAAALASFGTTGVDKDPRVTYTHMLCYKPLDQYDATTAFSECWNDWFNHMSSLPQTKKVKHSGKYVHFSLQVPIANGGIGESLVSLRRTRNEYFKGVAPVQMGGYQAHIFHFYPVITPIEGQDYLVDDLAKLMRFNKPKTHVYLVPAKADHRRREGFDPIGVIE